MNVNLHRIAHRNSRGARSRQRGISILTVVIVLIIGAILITGALLSLRFVDEAKVQNELQELTSLRGSTMLFAQQRGTNFTGVDLATITRLNFFPPERVSGTGATVTVANQWKGTVTVAPTTTVSTNDSLAFTYTGVPSAACNSLMTPAANIATAISVGGTAVKTNGGTLALATAQDQCTAASDNATIVYTFSK